MATCFFRNTLSRLSAHPFNAIEIQTIPLLPLKFYSNHLSAIAIRFEVKTVKTPLKWISQIVLFQFYPPRILSSTPAASIDGNPLLSWPDLLFQGAAQSASSTSPKRGQGRTVLLGAWSTPPPTSLPNERRGAREGRRSEHPSPSPMVSRTPLKHSLVAIHFFFVNRSKFKRICCCCCQQVEV